MDTVKDRLIQYIDYKGFSNRFFARSIGASPNILSTVSALGSNILRKINSTYPDLNMDWVITGRGEMLCKPGPTDAGYEQGTHKAEDDNPAYNVKKNVPVLPLFEAAAPLSVTLYAGRTDMATLQLLVSNHLFLQVLLSELAESKAVRRNISIEQAKAIILEKLSEQAAMLSAEAEPPAAGDGGGS